MKPFARINLSSVLSSVALAKGNALRRLFLVSTLAFAAAGCEPVPFATDDYAVEKGTVYFHMENPPCALKIYAFDQNDIAVLNDWLAHLNDGLSATYVTFAPDVCLDFDKLQVNIHPDAVIVHDKRNGDTWKQYHRKATKKDKHIRSMLLSKKASAVPVNETPTERSNP